MKIIFRLIYIKKAVTIFRYVTGLIMVIPLFIDDKIEFLKESNFDGIWLLAWMLFLIIQIKFFKRYKELGVIEIDYQKIAITFENNYSALFRSSENLKILIKYKGYKGEELNYSILQLPLFKKEGIGTIIIVRDGIRFEYKFLALKKYSKSLVSFSEYYEKMGSKVNIIWS